VVMTISTYDGKELTLIEQWEKHGNCNQRN
jgi:hypothetical protein